MSDSNKTFRPIITVSEGKNIRHSNTPTKQMTATSENVKPNASLHHSQINSGSQQPAFLNKQTESDKSPGSDTKANTTQAEDQDYSSLGAGALIKNLVKDLVDDLKRPVEALLEKKSETPNHEPIESDKQVRPKTPKSPAKALVDMGRKLRSRTKIVKPFKFRDPNFTK